MEVATPDSNEVRILRALLDAGEGFVSGQDLASSLRISRVAVWKRIEGLKRRGHDFEAVRRRGYRLRSFPDRPTASGVFARLPAGAHLRRLYLAESSPSTNDDAARLLASGEEAPLACLTRRQPGGKGRRGRSWSGDEEGNLYASLGFRPDASPRFLSLLPIRSGLSVCALLRGATGLDLRLKWPNDLLAGGRKVGGMLAESTVETNHVTGLVFGIGLNVNLSREQLPPALRETATSLAIEAGRRFDLSRIAALVLDGILGATEECLGGIDEERLAEDWAEFASFQGERVEVNDGDGTRAEGYQAGIDRSGALLLRTDDDRLRSFRAGDVSMRPATP